MSTSTNHKLGIGRAGLRPELLGGPAYPGRWLEQAESAAAQRAESASCPIFFAGRPLYQRTPYVEKDGLRQKGHPALKWTPNVEKDAFMLTLTISFWKIGRAGLRSEFQSLGAGLFGRKVLVLPEKRFSSGL